MRRNSLRVYVILLSLSQSGCASVGALAETFLVERETVTKGSFNTLQIGLSKAETLRRVFLLGASTVNAIPPTNFKASHEDTSGLSNLAQLDGIQLTDDGGRAITFYLLDGNVSSVFRSVPSDSEFRGIEGVTSAELQNRLRAALLADHDLVARPIVRAEENSAHRSDGAGLERLSKFDAWEFHIRTDLPRGSLYRVYFRDDRLARVEYLRQRVGLD